MIFFSSIFFSLFKLVKKNKERKEILLLFIKFSYNLLFHLICKKHNPIGRNKIKNFVLSFLSRQQNRQVRKKIKIKYFANTVFDFDCFYHVFHKDLSRLKI